MSGFLIVVLFVLCGLGVVLGVLWMLTSFTENLGDRVGMAKSPYLDEDGNWVEGERINSPRINAEIEKRKNK